MNGLRPVAGSHRSSFPRSWRKVRLRLHFASFFGTSALKRNLLRYPRADQPPLFTLDLRNRRQSLRLKTSTAFAESSGNLTTSQMIRQSDLLGGANVLSHLHPGERGAKQRSQRSQRQRDAILHRRRGSFFLVHPLTPAATCRQHAGVYRVRRRRSRLPPLLPLTPLPVLQLVLLHLALQHVLRAIHPSSAPEAPN